MQDPFPHKIDGYPLPDEGQSNSGRSALKQKIKSAGAEVEIWVMVIINIKYILYPETEELSRYKHR